MTDKPDPYLAAYQREKKARIEVEQLLEDSIRQLYERNVLLESQIVQIKNQQKSLIQQEKLALLGTLAAGVAHEINNPLAFVSSNVTTLNAYVSDLLNVIPKDSLNEADTRNINFIMSDLPELISDTEHGLVRIKDIVKNLLFFARTDADQLSEVDLLLAVEIALKLLGPKLKNVLVTQNLQPVPKIIFNSGELNQVLINILVNAIQACEYMTNHTSKIGVDLTQVNDEILLNVTDNGCGMSEEVQQRIFDAFYTTKPVGTGTGIGMSIVLQILEQHDAKIVVKSELNKGTSIQIYFPISTSM
ncbi:HAMP domain-containing histidine kinase [Shewanella sp. SR43-4]|jgi:signal transduction histidine kinase|uniref:sensor histidine kinase n=1 Tax=Shewanella TaxID=22 RepID=UPI000F500A41|nr:MULTISPECIES: ATP-binding protein [Shewanella]MBB1317155.1 HAMP domain-containing histidine kinase [Shewanella sp. SR43-4]MBB1322037.1 HAMP domain-containing histidine kinase [Shewanella sp. SR43-8]RPA56546.1 sensor histidine kinase [Shewanella vesiculosa]UJL43707.1 HAMP domain-containing histidine kinase [Shewanella vesiculosa]|tara:strand:+ start:11725 stop:12633 length:909 start_codon:yes stop_codon:yes gene_type:complete